MQQIVTVQQSKVQKKKHAVKPDSLAQSACAQDGTPSMRRAPTAVQQTRTHAG